MTTFSIPLNISGTSSLASPTTVTQNIASSDNISLTINTPTVAFTEWFLYDISGCSVSSTGGLRGDTITVTPIGGNTSYYATFITERFNEQSGEFIERYGKIQGSISGGATDTTPDAFTFTDQSNVALSSTITSNTITVAGIDAATSISITGGTYSTDGGVSYTGSSGTVTNGQTVSVRHTSSASNSTATNTTLNIGGVTDTFTSTTAAAAAPTYSVANASTNEGASATVNVTTTNVANGTTLYWTVDATTADVSTTSGSFTISANAGSFTIPAIADSLTEGTETYNIRVRTGSTAGTIQASSILTINDTSTTPAATYALTFYTTGFAQTSTFNEGDSFYVFINTTGVANGTYYWSTSSGSDLVAPVNGSFLIDANFGSLFLNIAADSLTEGTESLTLYIRSGSVSGTILGSGSITVNDTSTAPGVPTYSVANASTNEGASATVNVTTTNVANGTTLYWTVDATTADVSTTSGSFTISANAGSFTIPAIADSLTEGTETYNIRVRTGSTAGTIQASSILTINDTSTTPVATDTTPNAFIFADQSDVAVSSTITSAAITVLGINVATAISITGGTYSIDGGAYTSASGTVTNGQTVTVRHTSSASNSTATNTTLTIGGVSDVFTSTTIGVASSGNYGLRIYDSLGNITLDTTDITVKDFGDYTISSVTTNGTITGVPITTNTIALVNNNLAETGDSTIAPAAVTLAPASSSIVVSGGDSGFNISIRLMEF